MCCLSPEKDDSPDKHLISFYDHLSLSTLAPCMALLLPSIETHPRASSKFSVHSAPPRSFTLIFQLFLALTSYQCYFLPPLAACDRGAQQRGPLVARQLCLATSLAAVVHGRKSEGGKKWHSAVSHVTFLYLSSGNMGTSRSPSPNLTRVLDASAWSLGHRRQFTAQQGTGEKSQEQRIRSWCICKREIYWLRVLIVFPICKMCS